MKKAPAFQFYAAEWIADENVQLMTLEEEGAYIRLMAFCWREGSIPADPGLLSRLCKGAPAVALEVPLRCFEPGPEPGRLIHPRLEKERIKQQNFREKMSAAGRAGNEVRHHHRLPDEVGDAEATHETSPTSRSSSSSSSSSSTETKNPADVSPSLGTSPAKKRPEASPQDPGKRPEPTLPSTPRPGTLGLDVPAQPRPSQTPPLRRQRPTLEQVRAYILEKGYGVDPEKWFDHYTSNGWRVGKNPMVDWQAAIRTWAKSGGFNGQGKGTDRSGQAGGGHDPERAAALAARSQRHEM